VIRTTFCGLDAGMKISLSRKRIPRMARADRSSLKQIHDSSGTNGSTIFWEDDRRKSVRARYTHGV